MLNLSIEAGREGWDLHLVRRGFEVIVRADKRFFTIYDPAGNACGTLTRPADYGRPEEPDDFKWKAHNLNGELVAAAYSGAGVCLLRFVKAMQGEI